MLIVLIGRIGFWRHIVAISVIAFTITVALLISISRRSSRAHWSTLLSPLLIPQLHLFDLLLTLGKALLLGIILANQRHHQPAEDAAGNQDTEAAVDVQEPAYPKIWVWIPSSLAQILECDPRSDRPSSVRADQNKSREEQQSISDTASFLQWPQRANKDGNDAHNNRKEGHAHHRHIGDVDSVVLLASHIQVASKSPTTILIPTASVRC
mmetsp:Transcript_47233/g.112235  ORF Transcript_47233/g.112235 Transcript_47233/m.112235 type:complete len:210 (-) Transcript_47233:365-994(-)